MASSSGTHTWRFFRAGGSDQVAFERGADLLNLDQLDPKLWVALACPVKGLEFDERTLALIDGDKDSRVRVPEVIAAAKWAGTMVKNPDQILRGGDLTLDSINDATPDGKQLLASARQILTNLGKANATAITVADTMETAKVFAQTKFNGDGVLPVDSVDDAADKAVAADVVACLGAETDRSGKPGITQPKLDQFFAELTAFSDWWKKGESDAANLLPLGDATPAAVAALNAVRAKVDDYFARCRLAAFDGRALAAVNRQEAEYLAIAAKDMTITGAEIAGFPLARIEAGRALPLKDGLNPAWAGAIGALQAAAIGPVLGKDKTSLTEADWAQLKAKFGAYECWAAGKAGVPVEKLGVKRVRDILASKSKDALTKLIAQDKALEPEMNAIANVERLARFQRDLAQLLNNFVAFRDFYSRSRPAVFQIGTLYLDGRSCDLCVRVDDAGKHAALAGMAKCYLTYCDCTRPGGEKMSIAAAFTGGDADNLMVGRNGVFWDRKGRDWDATITKVIDNPISIRQAFWAPYKKLVRMIEEQVAKRAAAAEAASDAKVGAAATAAASADKAKPAEPKKMDVGTVAALGVAFGAIGTLLATLAGYLTGILTLPFWQVCLALAAILLLISTPSMLIAWLKLRQRNLGPILDANGWAVNGRVKMNVPFGGSLTKVAKIPSGAQSSFAVKYPEPPTVLPKLIFTIVAVCFLLSLLNYCGIFYKVSDGKYGSEAAWVIKKREEDAKKAKAEAEKALEEAKKASAAAAAPAPAAK
jgi:hypothetical protein